MDSPNISAALRWFDDVWNKKTPGSIAAMMSPRCVGHTEAGPVTGPEAFAQLHASFVAALPDLHFTIEAAIGEGDLVALRWRAVGTHSGAAFGLAPTGRTIEVRGSTWQRYEGGEMVEGWDFYNLGGLLTELAGGSA